MHLTQEQSVHIANGVVFGNTRPYHRRPDAVHVICVPEEGKNTMALAPETLKAMIRDYQGFPLSDDEPELIQPELDNYLQAIEMLQELDLSAVFSSRLLRVQEEGQA